MFECKRCANRRSPLCEICTQVTSPDGTEHKPKFYVEFNDVVGKTTQELGERGQSCREMLERYLSNGMALPVALVMEYNKFAE